MSVKEQLTDVFPISVSISSGEQPTANKLSGAFTQIETGMDKLSAAIGDCYGENYADGNTLFLHNRPATIASLTRLIGPASALNPLCQSLDTSTTESYLTVTFNRNTIPVNVNEFSLVDDCGVYPPIDFGVQLATTTERTPIVHSSIETALTAVDTAESTTVFTTRVDTIALVNSTGKYYVGTDGRVVTFDKTKSSYTSGTHTYFTKIFPDAYDGATYNVIPDFNESTNLCSTGSYLTSDHYAITLPNTSTKLSYLDSSGNPITPGNNDGTVPPTSYQLFLPRTLLSSAHMNLQVDDEVPEGFMYLWDDTTSAFVEGITFKIHDDGGGNPDYTVIDAYCDESVLTASSSNRYRLVTVGTTITESLAFLRRNYAIHDHSRIGYGKPISHSNLMDNRIEPSQISSVWGLTLNSAPSEITGNEHPQYLMRYGYVVDCDDRHHDNAMLGHLFLSKTSPTTTDASYIATTTDTSYKIYLGNTNNYIFKTTNALSVVAEEYLYLTHGSGESLKLFCTGLTAANNVITLSLDGTKSELILRANSASLEGYLRRVATSLTLYSPDILYLTGVSGVTITGTISGGVIGAGAITCTSLNASSGAISGGAITGSSLNIGSGAVTISGTTVTATTFAGTANIAKGVQYVSAAPVTKGFHAIGPGTFAWDASPSASEPSAPYSPTRAGDMYVAYWTTFYSDPLDITGLPEANKYYTSQKLYISELISPYSSLAYQWVEISY